MGLSVRQYLACSRQILIQALAVHICQLGLIGTPPVVSSLESVSASVLRPKDIVDAFGGNVLSDTPTPEMRLQPTQAERQAHLA